MWAQTSPGAGANILRGDDKLEQDQFTFFLTGGARMILEHPLLGVGPSGFKEAYLLTRENFDACVSQHPELKQRIREMAEARLRELEAAEVTSESFGRAAAARSTCESPTHGSALKRSPRRP